MTDTVAPVRPLIITASINRTAEEAFTLLRNRYFPPERNFLRAHITLFHAIPGDLLDPVRQDLMAACAKETERTAKITGVRFLGNGVALAVDCPSLNDIRSMLAERWAASLTGQDRQKFSPHITIQNKVPAETARALFQELETIIEKTEFSIEGLSLWHYDGGPWEPEETFFFNRFKV